MTAVISIFGEKGLRHNQGDFVPLLCNSVRRLISVLAVICRFAAMMGFIRLVTVILSVLLAGKGLFMMISRDILFIIMAYHVNLHI